MNTEELHITTGPLHIYGERERKTMMKKLTKSAINSTRDKFGKHVAGVPNTKSTKHMFSVLKYES